MTTTPSETVAVRIPGAVKRTGLSRSTIYRLVRQKKLSIRKCGRTSLVLCVELDRLVESLPTSDSKRLR